MAIAAVAGFAVLDTSTKFVSASVPVLMALWVRYMFQAVATTALVLPMRGRSVLRTAHPKFQFLRGVLLMMSSLLAFFSLKYMPVGEFTAIAMISPLVITLLAAVALKEHVSVARWLLVLGGFAGTMIIIRPGQANFAWTMLLPLGLVVTNALFQVLTSKMARTEDPVTMHIYTGWVGSILITIFLPFVWVPLPTVELWGWLLLMGLAATLGHFMLILAYQRAPAATLTPYLYTGIGFAMLGGWLVFSHVPDTWSIIGMVMIAVCGALGAWLAVKEGRLRMEVID
ncbi:MAG TPA: DMT family transporter [Burkholderiaceae bacterium]|nr:DMT family transporter [Burkholderiaceae bacterium]